MEPLWETALLLAVFVAAKGLCAGVALPLCVTLLVWARAWFMRELPAFAGIAKAQEAARLQAEHAGTAKAQGAARLQAEQAGTAKATAVIRVKAGSQADGSIPDQAHAPPDKLQPEVRASDEQVASVDATAVCPPAAEHRSCGSNPEDSEVLATEVDRTSAKDTEAVTVSAVPSETARGSATPPKIDTSSAAPDKHACPDATFEQAATGVDASTSMIAPEEDEVGSQGTDDWIHVTRESQLEDATQSKEIGNACFKRGEWADAIVRYQEAEGLAPEDAIELRKQCYGNRAACHLRLDNPEQAERDCTRALELDDTYLKVILRRADAREKLGKWQEAHDDLQKAVEIDPSQQAPLRQRLAVLDAKARQKLEEDKAEMMGKLKDLGNTVLGKFGMSMNNFACEQDPATGSYSIQFKQ